MKKMVPFVLVLFAISKCDANDFLCQIFNENSKSVEKYCGLFNGVLPNKCSKDLNIEPSDVNRLKLNGCNSAIVVDAQKNYNNLLVLDISASGYNTLDWINLRLEYLQIFNASYNEIPNITTLFLYTPNINEIDLSHNKLKKLNSTSFGQLNTLVKINLSYNNLEHINFDVFAAATNLESIDLSNNNFFSLPEFSHNGKLTTIHLEENMIKNFTCQRIPWMRSISVYLSWTYIKMFDGHEHCKEKQLRVVWNNDVEGIFGTQNGSYELHYNSQSFHNIRYFKAGRNSFSNAMELLNSFDEPLLQLDLTGNHLEQLEINSFQKFTNLTELHLSNTSLVQFDFDMLTCEQSLKSLDISYNPMINFNNISHLKRFNLKQFNVAGNKLTGKITSRIMHYLNPSIEVLDLSHNNIRFSYNFEKLIKLNVLIVSNSNFTFSDSNPFELLTNLHVLDLSHNNLSTVNFTKLSNTLHKLLNFNIAYCQIENIFDVIQYLGASIQKLNIAGNQITGLNATTFQTLPNLIHLNLSATHLTHFDFDVINNLKWLQTLDISFNELLNINLHLLPKNSYLEYLHLQGNKLTKLDYFKPNASPYLAIGLAENQFPCTYLKKLKHEFPGLRFIGNALNQKHRDDCRSSIQAINDFLGSVYETVKFW